jgi:ATP-dependent exoDNAse (exonuclease V) beta subunit
MKFANLPTDEIIKTKKKKSEKEETEKTEENEIGFTAANFGTMAHAYIEHYFKEKNLSKNKEPKLPAVILEKLSPTEIEIVKKDAKLLATSFIESELGKKAYNSSWVKSEYDFKMAVEKNQNVYIVDGQIDLIFRDDETGKIVVVDFKTDFEIEPQKHYEQLAIYKKVAAELGNVDVSNVETRLYYLRYGL